MATPHEIANVEQAAAWDGHEGDQWTTHADRYDRSARRARQRFFDAGLIGAGDTVVDIGCGTGRATRDAARSAAPGSVLGVDLSAQMLDLARTRAATEGLDNVEFRQGDAQVYAFEPERFDLAMSCFGAMFFGDPVAAYTNIGRALRPGGRLALLAWQGIDRNDWLLAIRAAVAMGRELPVPPTDGVSPFALSNPDRVRGILSTAGYRDVDFTAIEEPVDLGDDAADAYAFCETMGMVEGLTENLDEGDRAEAMARLQAMCVEHARPEGVLLGSSVWLITATR